MNVEILDMTRTPIFNISVAAGTCYGKDDPYFKRVERCYESGHMSVFEHAYVTFAVDGLSRACSHQLVRHRLASFCQQSQRYCKIDVEDDEWFVMPDSLDEDGQAEFVMQMAVAATTYERLLERGVRPEDARYALPEACKTKIVCTMNCRELFHFLDMRQSKAAQWEIRRLAELLEEQLSKLPEWCSIMELRRA